MKTLQQYATVHLNSSEIAHVLSPSNAITLAPQGVHLQGETGAPSNLDNVGVFGPCIKVMLLGPIRR